MPRRTRLSAASSELVVVRVQSGSVARMRRSLARPPKCSLRIDEMITGTPASLPAMRPMMLAW